MANAAEQQAKQAFDYSQSQGKQLVQNIGETAEQFAARQKQVQDKADAYFQNLVTSGGYTPFQASQIIGQQASGGVPGLDELAQISDAEKDSNFLPDWAAGAISGDPYRQQAYLNSENIRNDAATGAQRQDKAVAGLKSGLQGAIDPSKLALDKNYAASTLGQVGSTKSALDAIGTDPSLDVDADYASKQEMTPEQQQDIINAAGTTVGKKAQGFVEDQRRRADAAGIGSLGQGALEGRALRGAESDAADAMTNARIAASNAAAARGQTVQQTKLGAGQARAGIQQQGAEFSGAHGLDALKDIEGKRIASEQDISNRNLQAATTGGLSDIANASNETQTQLGTQENIRNAEVEAQRDAEAKQQGRGQTLATNQQATQQKNNQTAYDRGASANQALSTRYGQVGTTQLGQQNKGGDYLAGQGAQAQQGSQTATGQQVGAFQATTGAGNQSAAATNAALNTPGLGDKIFGGILGAVSKFEDGGIADQPTLATIGEAGPEMVVPLSGAGGSPDSRPIGGTDAPPRDPNNSDQVFHPQPRRETPMNFGNMMQRVGSAAGGAARGAGLPFNRQPQPQQGGAPGGGLIGMAGRALKQRYGQRPGAGGQQTSQAVPSSTFPQPGAGQSAPISGGAAPGSAGDRYSQYAMQNRYGDQGDQGPTPPAPVAPPPPQPTSIAPRHVMPSGAPPQQATPPPAAGGGLEGLSMGSHAHIVGDQEGGAPAPTMLGGAHRVDDDGGASLGINPDFETEDPLSRRYGGGGPEMLGGANKFSGDMMAGGGIVTKPTRAIIGEHEPEMVIPLRPGMAGGNGARMRPSAMGGFGRRYGT